MPRKPSSEAPVGGTDPPELAPVEQSLRAKIAAMNYDELSALAVAVQLELDNF